MIREDRRWMYNRVDDRGRLRTEFVEKVDEFIDFALQHPICNDGDKIRCPCKRCSNKRYLDVDTIRVHLYKKGFKENYFRWLSHGDTVMESSSSSIQANEEFERQRLELERERIALETQRLQFQMRQDEEVRRDEEIKRREEEAKKKDELIQQMRLEMDRFS